MDNIPFFFWRTISIVLLFTVNVKGKECTGTLNNNYVRESCSVGGCCVPSDGDGDTLCCIPTLTIILVSVFVGGAIVVLIVIIICCVVCRYQNKRKHRRRQEERRRRQRERDEERQRRLMDDPFVNGDPFQAPSLAQPPRYHGEHSDQSQVPARQAPTTTQTSQQTPLTDIPPPYPISPPPAYYSRIMNCQEAPQQLSNSGNVSSASTIINRQGTPQVATTSSRIPTVRSRATNSKLQSRSDLTPGDIQILNSPAPTELPYTPYSRTSNYSSRSRVSTNIPSVSRTLSSRNTQSSLTISDLESNVTDDELSHIYDVDSRMSSAKFTEQDQIKQISRNSSKADSRMSSSLRIMSAIHEDGTFTKTPTRSRGRFIKSTLSNISEGTTIQNSAMTYTPSLPGRNESRASSMQSYVRTVDPHEPVVSNYLYV